MILINLQIIVTSQKKYGVTLASLRPSPVRIEWFMLRRWKIAWHVMFELEKRKENYFNKYKWLMKGELYLYSH